MTGTTIETRNVGPYVCGAAVFAACAALTFYFSRSMSGGMAMSGGWTMSMMWMRMAGQSWLGAAAMFVGMWIAMMIAMMLPSFLPLILRGVSGGHPFTLFMLLGYFYVWTAAGAVIYALGVLLALASMRWAVLSHANPYLCGAAVILAGVLQFSSWKAGILSRCRGPFSCASPKPHEPPLAAWRQGVKCGRCCVACCFGPTLVLLALGMMNLMVIGVVAVWIGLEKLSPNPRYIVRLAGICAVVGGIAMVLRYASAS